MGSNRVKCRDLCHITHAEYTVLTHMYLCEGKPKIISRHSSNADVGAFFCIAALLQHGGITKQTPTHDIRGIDCETFKGNTYQSCIQMIIKHKIEKVCGNTM